MSRGRARAAALAGVALLAGAVACADVGGGPTTVISLAFDTSTVAVVVGDTLRDTLGALLPLRAAAFDATGDTIREPAVAISYVATAGDSTDPAPALRLVGPLAIGLRSRPTPTRVFATAGGLQSLPKTIDVVRRPNRVVPVAPLDSAVYLAGSRSVVSTGGSQLRVTADPADTAAVVRRVEVRFAVERAAPLVADSVAVVDERTATATLIPRSPLDTTDARGVAGRRVLVFLREGAAATDTVVLRAVAAYPARYRSPTLAGDTVRIRVAVRR